MKHKIIKMFKFEASHRLWDEDLSEEENFRIFGKCANYPSHGHSYKVKLFIEEEKLTYGMVMNFSAVKEIFNKKIHKRLDHHFLNGVLPVLTTAENIAQWIFSELVGELDYLYKVEVWETETSCGIYEP